MEKMDIIVLAGQSNAVGFGGGDVSKTYITDERILIMKDNSDPCVIVDADPVYLRIKWPANSTVTVAEEPAEQDGNLALTFAAKYVNKYLASDRKLLIVHAAVGGTGFARPEWGVGNPLHIRMLSMVKEALSYNSENRVVAFLWHQGEHDSFENADWDVEKRYQTHKINLDAMLDEFYAQIGDTSVPFIAGGFCDEWYLANKEPCDAVLKAIRECCAERGGAFVETSGLLSNNQKIGTGDVIHFCKESLHILGEKYFDAYDALAANL